MRPFFRSAVIPASLVVMAGAGYGCTMMTAGDSFDEKGSGSPNANANANGGGERNAAVPGPPAPSATAPSTPRDAGSEASAPTCEGFDPTKPETLYLSVDDSNSMASPAIARAMIRAGREVPARMIRTYEFLNYYNVRYEPAAAGALRIVPELRRGEDGKVELNVGVQSEAPRAVRRPMTITLVLDTSGSMDNGSLARRPIERERDAIRAIATQLREGDILSAVTWNTAQRVVLDGVVASGPDDPRVLELAKSLVADGGTDLDGGLVKGYELAQKHHAPGRMNRVVLISDGIANVGVTEEKLIGEKAESNDREGIYLVGVGVGDGVNDTLLDTVTDAGRGAYVFLDSADEAQKVLGSRFDEVMEVAARAVQVKLTLPWYLRMNRFYGEEYSSDPSKVKPQHLAPGDSMVFHQLVRACDASKIADGDAIEVTATWTDPTAYDTRTATASSTIGALAAGDTTHLKRARAIIDYAEALKLGRAQGAKSALESARASVIAAKGGAADPELDEILSLIDGLVQKTP